MEKFSRDSNISLSFADLNATHLSLGLRITKKFGVRISIKHCSFFKKIERGKFQFCMAKTTSTGECKLPKNEIILSCSIFGILHRRRFHLILARKQTSTFTRSCYWEEFVVHWPIWLFVLKFFWLNFNLIETCPKLMYVYLCSFSLRISATRLSHDIVSPHYTSWKRGKQRKCSW